MRFAAPLCQMREAGGMRPMPLIFLSAAIAVTLFLSRDRLSFPLDLQEIFSAKAIETLPSIKEIRSYTDADFHFEMAVPIDWTAIVANESLGEIDELETSYAVGFESPRTDENDNFADYIMVEIIPGRESGAFETDGSLEKAILIDGHPAKKDELRLRDYHIAGDKLDLQVFQAELHGLGYSVSFYAIGEHRESVVLRDAFRLMIETFKLPPNLFDLS